MDMINGLCDDVLVKILTFLPTKVAVSTSVLSKRWKYLWRRVQKLEYDDTDIKTKTSKSRKRFRRFVKRNLLIDRDGDLESLSLKLSTIPFQPEDIESWVGFAVSRGVRELSIAYSSYRPHPARLPISLYTCKSLVSLELEESVSVCVPRAVFLPSLKVLRIWGFYGYFRQEVFQHFLSGCPVLEDLLVERRLGIYIGKFTVKVPSLQRLSLEINYDNQSEDGYVIDTPSLKYFKFKDRYNFHYCSITSMPKLEEAYIDVIFPDINKFLKPITSVKRLSLCLTLNCAEDVYSDGIVFNELQHLKLCTCNTYWPKLLVRLLQDSPKLRVLELYVNEHSSCSSSPMVCWKNQPSYVPQCFATSLEAFKWIGCEGRQEERDLVTYILSNARCLKTATILTESRTDPQRKLEMISELTFSSKASTTCKLAFH